MATPQPRPGLIFAAGILAARAGLCTQTHGVLFAGLLAIRLLSDPGTRTARMLAAAAAGVITALLLTATALWYAGILPETLEHVVLWPLRYYRQPGGVNEAPPECWRLASRR